MPTAEQFLQTRKKRRRAPASQGHPSQGRPTVGGGTRSKPVVYRSPSTPRPGSQGHPSQGRPTVGGGTRSKPTRYKSPTPSVKVQRRRARFEHRQAAKQRRRLRRLSRSLPDPARQLAGVSLRQWRKDMPKDTKTRVLGVDIETPTESALKATTDVGKFLKGSGERLSRGQKQLEGGFRGKRRKSHGGTMAVITAAANTSAITKRATEASELASNLPSGVYIAGDAANQARKGNTKPAEKLFKQWKKQSPVGQLVSGGGVKGAAKAFGKNPTAGSLELAGAYSAAGRVAGAGVRGGARLRGKPLSTERPAVGHRAYRRTGVAGPQRRSRYSKNIFTRIGQQAADKRRVRREENETPEQAHRRARQQHAAESVPGTQARAHSLRSRVDTRHHSQSRRARQREQQAMREEHDIGSSAGKYASRRPKKRREEREARKTVVQLAAEWTLRDPKRVRRDLERAKRDADAAEERARQDGPESHELNRAEAARIEAALRLSDDQLRNLMGESRRVAEAEAPRQKRSEAEGVLTRKQRARRWYPALQGQMRPAPRTKTTGGIPDRELFDSLRGKSDVARARIRREANATIRQVDKQAAAIRARIDRAIDNGDDAALEMLTNKASRLASRRSRAARTVQIIDNTKPGKRGHPSGFNRDKQGRLSVGTFAERQARVEKGEQPQARAIRWQPDDDQVNAAAAELGLRHRVVIRRGVGGMDSGYRWNSNGQVHIIEVPSWFSPARANSAIFHELQHARQKDRGKLVPGRKTAREYHRSTQEVEARVRANLSRTKGGKRMLVREVDEVLPTSAARRRVRHPDEQIIPENTMIEPGRARAPKSRLAEATEAQQVARMRGADPHTGKRRARVKAKRVPKKQEARAALRTSALDRAAQTLERRHRAGKSTLRGPTDAPVLISQRRTNVSAPAGVEPMNFPVGKRHGTAYSTRARPTGSEALRGQLAMSERMATSAESRHANLREFGIPAGKNGRVFAETQGEALRRAAALTAENGVEYEAVLIAGKNVTGPRLKAIQRRVDPTGTVGPQAKAESGNGRWLLVPKEVGSRFRAHEAVSKFEQVQGIRQGRAITGGFKDVVLTTVNPTSWLSSNVIDLTMRGILEGLTPMDLVRGRRGTNQLMRGEHGPQGEEAFHSVTSGGLYGTGEALGRGTRGAAPLRPFRGYRDFIYKVEHGMERALQDAAFGKQMRQGTDRQMALGLSGLMKVNKKQITAYTRGVARDRDLEAEAQAAIENVIGRWGKVSPAMRATLTVAPFAQWLGAATRYVFLTLPTKHPIKTGIMAGIMQMTEEERIRLGLSHFAPRGKQAQDYQMGMLPTGIGQNKFGPVVEGIRTGHMTSFGTAGGFPENWQRFLLPQVQGALTAAFGNSWTGERLVYPPWWPEKGKRGLPLDKEMRMKVALGMLIEATVPFASTIRKNLIEQGETSHEISTILTPESRRERVGKGNKYVLKKRSSKGALIDWIDPRATGRVFTQDAVRAMSNNEATFGPGGTMERLKRQREQEKNEEREGSWFKGDTATKPKKKVRRKEAKGWWN